LTPVSRHVSFMELCIRLMYCSIVPKRNMSPHNLAARLRDAGRVRHARARLAHVGVASTGRYPSMVCPAERRTSCPRISAHRSTTGSRGNAPPPACTAPGTHPRFAGPPCSSRRTGRPRTGRSPSHTCHPRTPASPCSSSSRGGPRCTGRPRVFWQQTRCA
jgi:hypothetical protein